MQLRDKMNESLQKKTNDSTITINANTLFENYQAEMVNLIKQDLNIWVNDHQYDVNSQIRSRKRLHAIFDNKNGLSPENRKLLLNFNPNGLLTEQEIKELLELIDKNFFERQ